MSDGTAHETPSGCTKASVACGYIIAIPIMILLVILVGPAYLAIVPLFICGYWMWIGPVELFVVGPLRLLVTRRRPAPPVFAPQPIRSNSFLGVLDEYSDAHERFTLARRAAKSGRQLDAAKEAEVLRSARWAFRAFAYTALCVAPVALVLFGLKIAGVPLRGHLLLSGFDWLAALTLDQPVALRSAADWANHFRIGGYWQLGRYCAVFLVLSVLVIGVLNIEVVIFSALRPLLGARRHLLDEPLLWSGA